MTASREAATYFDKIERYELQETLAYSSFDWLLSTEDTRITVEPPRGLIAGIQIPSDFNNCLLLIPEEHGIEPLELREMHQIVRELVTGIFILNQRLLLLWKQITTAAPHVKFHQLIMIQGLVRYFAKSITR